MCCVAVGDLDYSETIDDASNLVREVLGGVFTQPADPPPADRAALADQLTACVLELGDTAT